MTDQKANPPAMEKRLFAVSGVILASVAFVMELTLLPLLLVEIQNDFELTLRGLSWVFNSYAIAVALAVILTGIIGDRVDKIVLFTIGVLLFAMGSIFSSLSESYSTLIIARTVQGFGGGLFSPLIPILLSQVFHERPGKILIIWGCIAGIAATLMPLLGGLTIEAFGWQTVFLYFALVAVLSLLLSLTLRPFKEERSPKISISRHIFEAKPVLWPLLGYVFVTYGAFSSFIFYFPIKLTDVGHSNEYIAYFVTTVWLLFSLLSYVLRNKVDSQHLISILLAAPIFLAVGFLLGISQLESDLIPILAAAFAGAGLACCNAPSTHLLLKSIPSESHAFASSMDIIFARCGGVVMVALITSASIGAVGWGAVGAAALALVLCVVCFALAREDAKVTQS